MLRQKYMREKRDLRVRGKRVCALSSESIESRVVLSSGLVDKFSFLS